MLKHWWVSQNANTLASSQFLYLTSFKSNPRNHPKFNLARYPKKPGRLTCVVKVGLEDIADIIHNKVLIAAGVSAAIGQLSKPFTSVILNGKDLDFRTAFQAGGFPSTHSSSAVAAATALALERGFADSIFGLSVVYAGLIMYDAQGVRREVGNHARVLNKLSTDAQLDSREQIRFKSTRTVLTKGAPSFLAKLSKAPQVLRSNQINEFNQNDQIVMYKPSPLLKESIGHTEVEVVAGALLGFFVSLVVYTIL